MKADAARLVAAASKGDPAPRLYLVHGPDESGARALAGMVAEALGEAERVDLLPATLRSSPGLLADEAASLSLFGGSRYIRVLSAGDEIADALGLLLAAPNAGNPVIVVASPTIRTTSRLVKLALASPLALAAACYEPSAAGAEHLAAELVRAQGLQPDRGVVARLIEAVGGDRMLLAREVEKLALYLDAAPDRPKPLDEDAVDAIGADLVDADSDAFVRAVAGGHVAEAGELLGRLADAGQSAIPWLRALVRRLLLLGELRGQAGGDLAGALQRARIHFTQEGEIRANLQHWPSAAIEQALVRLREAERAIMAAGTAGDILARSASLDIARRAARR